MGFSKRFEEGVLLAIAMRGERANGGGIAEGWGRGGVELRLKNEIEGVG